MSPPPANLKQSIKNLDTLPAMPVIAQKLLTLQLDTDEGEREMLRLIGQDPQMAAKIIGLANTPMFGAPRKVSSVGDAAMLLGIPRVKSVAIGIAVVSALSKHAAGRLNVQDLWLHSLSVALTARAIARAMPARIRPLDDQIFLAGLLHDIGYLVLAGVDIKRSNQLHERLAAKPDRAALEVEQDMLGTSHCELGAELLRQWGLPDEIITVLRYHHAPDEPDAQPAQPLVRLVNIAEKLHPTFGIAGLAADGIGGDEWQALEIDPAEAQDVFARIAELEEQTRQFAGAFA
jgi:putative nucleotidyltransferase with HDIG domain